jgi:hypothetical protein
VSDVRPGDAERRRIAEIAAARRRPVLVEIASAILIVSGVLNLITTIDVLFRLAGRGESIGGLTVSSIVISTVTIGLGLAVRAGRAWLLALNVIAVFAFLELTSGTPVGLLFGALDLVVVLALLSQRPWFQRPGPELASPEEARS